MVELQTLIDNCYLKIPTLKEYRAFFVLTCPESAEGFIKEK